MYIAVNQSSRHKPSDPPPVVVNEFTLAVVPLDVCLPAPAMQQRPDRNQALTTRSQRVNMFHLNPYASWGILFYSQSSSDSLQSVRRPRRPDNLATNVCGRLRGLNDP